MVGTSGWSYRHWRGVFYPAHLPARDWLRFYAQRFSTVELNTSFYRRPAAASLARWREAAGPGFLFAVKANRFITHVRRLREPADPVARELEAVRPLGDALGPILLQLPPDLGLDLGRLRTLVEALPEARRFAVEFRDRSWDAGGVYDLLGEHGVAVCLHDWRGRTWPVAAAENGAAFVYVRLHGPTGTYTGRYDARTLAVWAERCARWRRAGRDVFCYFNNDAAGNAVHDALYLRGLLGEDAGAVAGA
ncbi:MAG: DUF72 domain-containing protein [Actinobacteria bacterium]|nr:DUF72 domain-containing protein [Actinomycetota bacterium]